MFGPALQISYALTAHSSRCFRAGILYGKALGVGCKIFLRVLWHNISEFRCKQLRMMHKKTPPEDTNRNPELTNLSRISGIPLQRAEVL